MDITSNPDLKKGLSLQLNFKYAEEACNWKKYSYTSKRVKN